MEKKMINLKGYEGLYYIYEDGTCYSIRKQRYLKPTLNNFKYVQYFLTPHKGSKFGKWFKAHRLVLIAFKGYDADPNRKEVNHIDHNKQNNHISNLEWVTHSENILKSFQEGYRQGYWKDKVKGSPSLETRLKMSGAKNKPVKYINKQTGNIVVYESIQHACKALNTYYKKVYRILYNKRIDKIMHFEFI